MKTKIKILKQLFQEKKDYYPIIPQEYTDYCEEDDNQLPVGLFQSTTLKFRFCFTKYSNLQSHTKCVLELDKRKNELKTKVSSKSFEIKYNSIQKKIYERMYGSVSSFDTIWFQRNDEFIFQLPVRDKFALVAMTNKSQQHIQAYLKGEMTNLFKNRVRRWKTEIHGYLPIFFQIYDRYKNEIKQKKHLTEKYHYIVKEICPKLTDETIDLCIIELVKQIRHIFSSCPKTTIKMTLWRGLRSMPEGSSSSYAGFTSLSLNPFHTLNYTGKECCLQKITILPKTPLLFIGGLSSFKNELECVLPDNMNFFQIKREYESVPVVLKMKKKCPKHDEMKRIIVQHTVVV